MSNSKRPGVLSSVYLTLLLLGGALAFAGDRLSLPVLTNLALLCIGLLMVLVGGELIVTKRAVFALGGLAYTQGKEVFEGLAAQLWGVLFLGLGMLVILFTLARWFAPYVLKSYWSTLQGTPAGVGLALFGLGVMAVLYGAIRLLAGSAGLDLGALTGLSNFLDRMAGAVVLLIGLGLVLVGLLLIVAPGIVFALIEQLKTLILQLILS
jgi:hypothetical protein